MKLKHQIRLAIAIMLGVSLLAESAFAKDITIKKDGVVQEYTTKPIIYNDYTMVGMRNLFNELGASVVWNAESRSVDVKIGTTTATIVVGSKEAIVNGQTVSLPVEPILVNNVLMVPLRCVKLFFGYRVDWDAESQTVSISTSQSDTLALSGESLLNSLIPNYEGTILTYEAALDKAISGESRLKAISDSLELVEEARKNSEIDFLNLPWDEAKARALRRAMSNLEYQMQNVSQSEQQTKDLVEYTLRSSLNSIWGTELEIIRLKESIKLNELYISNLEVKNSVGLASELDVTEAKRSQEQSITQLAAAELNLASQKQSVNFLLGYKADDNILVDFRPAFEKFEFDMDDSIRKIPSQPNMIILERAIEQAKYEYDSSGRTMLEGATGQRGESTLEKKNALLEAERDYADAKQAMEKGIRDQYNAILSGEETQRSLELALEKAIDTYNSVLVNYQVGTVTLYEVEQAKLGILNAEINIEKNISSLDAQKFVIYKPYLISGS